MCVYRLCSSTAMYWSHPRHVICSLCIFKRLRMNEIAHTISTPLATDFECWMCSHSKIVFGESSVTMNSFWSKWHTVQRLILQYVWKLVTVQTLFNHFSANVGTPNSNRKNTRTQIKAIVFGCWFFFSLRKAILHPFSSSTSCAKLKWFEQSRSKCKWNCFERRREAKVTTNNFGDGKKTKCKSENHLTEIRRKTFPQLHAYIYLFMQAKWKKHVKK